MRPSKQKRDQKNPILMEMALFEHYERILCGSETGISNVKDSYASREAALNSAKAALHEALGRTAVQQSPALAIVMQRCMPVEYREVKLPAVDGQDEMCAPVCSIGAVTCIAQQCASRYT